MTPGDGGGRHRIAVMPGDGVGPEMIAQAERVLLEVSSIEGLDLELVNFPHGGAHFRATGELLSDDSLDRLRSCESLLFGAAGDPELPAGTMERALILDLAAKLGLSVGDRVFYLHNPLLSPLKDLRRGDVDMLIVRDISEGEIALPGGSVHQGEPEEVAVGLDVYTRVGVERAVRRAFVLAGDRRRKVSIVVQSNSLAAHRIWETVGETIASEYPTVSGEICYPDTASARMVSKPWEFDVIASTVLIGGTLSSLAAAVIGGIGAVGSSRINPSTGFGMFEPAHGSAPRHAGIGSASPVGTINATAMLLENIGERGAALRVHDAVDLAVTSGAIPGFTARCGMGTEEATDVVIGLLKQQVSFP